MCVLKYNDTQLGVDKNRVRTSVRQGWGQVRRALSFHSSPRPCTNPATDRVVEKACLAFPVTVYAATAKSLQSCPTLYNPMDCSPPDSSVHGILQAKILEWIAMPSFKGSS